MRHAIAMLTICLTTTLLWADRWAPPKPQTYTQGPFTLDTVPINPQSFTGPATATLRRTEKDRAAVELWKTKLVNIPHQALISEDGAYVVTIDTYARLGYQHVVVLYGAQGKLIADFALEDLLTKEEIAKHVPQTVSSRHWYGKDTRISFDLRERRLAINFAWGKTAVISLETGKIVR